MVAGEVKELARETARATEDIARRVEAIQAGTNEAVATIGQVGDIIDRISERQSLIAAAVEEQTATTREMSRGAGQTAAGAAEIADSVATVAESASASAQSAQECLDAARDLAAVAGQLRQQVAGFRR